MSLQSSGPISLGDIQKEFGGTPSTALGEYYYKQKYVKNSNNNKIPSSGTNKFSNYYGSKSTSYVVQTITYSARPSKSENVPNWGEVVTFSGLNNSVYYAGFSIGSYEATISWQTVSDGEVINSGSTQQRLFASWGGKCPILGFMRFPGLLPFRILQTPNVRVEKIAGGGRAILSTLPNSSNEWKTEFKYEKVLSSNASSGLEPYTVRLIYESVV